MNKFNRHRLYFWVFLALNLAFIAWSKNHLQPLTTGDIVKFEVAKTTERAELIKAEWTQNGKLEKAIDSIQIDYLFIILYTGLLIAGVLFFSKLSRHVLLFRMGRFVTYLLPIAAICDIIENIAMTKNLTGTITGLKTTLAYDMAVAKFSIIILALIFLFVCLLSWIGSKLTPARYHPTL